METPQARLRFDRRSVASTWSGDETPSKAEAFAPQSRLGIARCDIFGVPTNLPPRKKKTYPKTPPPLVSPLYGLLIMGHGRRTSFVAWRHAHPNADGSQIQVTKHAVGTAPRYLSRDRTGLCEILVRILRSIRHPRSARLRRAPLGKWIGWKG